MGSPIIVNVKINGFLSLRLGVPFIIDVYKYKFQNIRMWSPIHFKARIIIEADNINRKTIFY